MTKVSIILMLTVLLAMPLLGVAEVEVNLDGTTSENAFIIKNDNPTPDSLLKVGGNGNVRVKPNSYLNYGNNIASEGASGYGFRDNGGILEYKNVSGVWTPWVTNIYGDGTGTFSYGQIAYNHGNYGDTQPSVLPGPISGYLSLFPATLGLGGGTPYEIIEGGAVSVAYVDSKPAYLKILSPGYYRISANIALLGTNNSSLEVEIFRQNSASVPAVNSWVTNVHDLESLSTAISNTNGQYDAGSLSGIVYLNSNDYIALCARVISGAAVSQKIVSANLNVERVK